MAQLAIKKPVQTRTIRKGPWNLPHKFHLHLVYLNILLVLSKLLICWFSFHVTTRSRWRGDINTAMSDYETWWWSAVAMLFNCNMTLFHLSKSILFVFVVYFHQWTFMMVKIYFLCTSGKTCKKGSPKFWISTKMLV